MHNKVKTEKAETVVDTWRGQRLRDAGGRVGAGVGVMIPSPPNKKASFSLSSLS